MQSVLDLYKNNIQDFSKRYECSGEIHEDDHIFSFLFENNSFRDRESAIQYYFSDGLNSASTLYQLLVDSMKREDKLKVLEFASGYGCVTRHLTKLSNFWDITSCDIHPEAVRFIIDKLKVSAIESARDPKDLKIMDSSYDVVFCLSFFSHIPDIAWSKWLIKLYDIVKDGGLLIFTTHGFQSMKFFNSPKLSKEGYWFWAVSEQKDLDTADYGQTIVTPAYVSTRIKWLSGNPIIEQFKEGFWWGHQDLWVVRKS